MDFIELLIFLIFQIKTKSNKFNRNNEIILFLRKIDYKTVKLLMLIMKKILLIYKYNK